MPSGPARTSTPFPRAGSSTVRSASSPRSRRSSVRAAGRWRSSARKSAAASGRRRFAAAGPLPEAYIELHIEQGPRLAGGGRAARGRHGDRRLRPRRGRRRGAAGPRRDDADGRCATTRSSRRRGDPPAARRGGRDRRGRLTVGQIEAEPGGINVIPGRVATRWTFARPDQERLDRAVAARGDRRFERGAADRDEPGDPGGAARRDRGRGLPVVELPSGAGHDAGVLARAGVPSGMLFVRSLNGGVSHSPDELSSEEDIALGDRRARGDATAVSEKRMSCAPSQRTSSPIACRCSTPSTTVAKWFPASWPALLAKQVSPYGNRISTSLTPPG